MIETKAEIPFWALSLKKTVYYDSKVPITSFTLGKLPVVVTLNSSIFDEVM
jgi:hypothetical protein